MAKKFAVPELVLGLPWIIREGHGKTSPKEKLFVSPMGTDPHSRSVRAHELAHIKWSPKDPARAMRDYIKAGGNAETLNAVEDARVNILASQNGVDLEELYPVRDLEEFRNSFLSDPVGPLDRDAKLQLARAYMVLRAYYHSGSGPDKLLFDILCGIEKAFGPLAPKIGKVFTTLNSRPERFSVAKRCALAIDLLFPPEEKVAPLSEQLSDMALKNEDRPGTYDVNARWLPMRVLWLPMPRVSRGALMARSTRPADIGTLKYVHRVPPMGDGNAFGIRRKIMEGGGILIDNSGSMGLPPSEVVKLVELAPFGRVAKYSSERTFGTLAVLADKGRLTKPEDIARDFGSGNGIDGPALRWIVSNSRPPYVWVSDTYVTGAGDKYSEKLLRECMDIVRKHGVTICHTVEEAVRYLSSIKARR